MLQRHAAYLQRGQRFGSFARGGGLHLSSKERKQTEEELNQAEIKIDALLSGKDVDLECKEMQNCVVNINAKLSGRLTHELWQLVLTSLRASTGATFAASPRDVSAAYLLHSAGGPAAAKRDLLRFLAAALQRKCSIEQNLFFLKQLEYTEDIDALASRLSPGSPLTLQLQGERRPRVQFKRPYKGINLRVPRKSFARGELFELTTNYLKYKYSSTEVYDEPHPVAVEGDALLLQVEAGWFEDSDGAFGPQIPAEFICGNTTLDLVQPWIPSELLEAVRGISVGESRTVSVSLPFRAVDLLNINARESEQKERVECIDTEGKDLILKQKIASNYTAEQNKENNIKQEGQSLVSLYLNNIANTTKDGIFNALIGQTNNDADAAGQDAAAAAAAAAATPDAGAAARSADEAAPGFRTAQVNEEEEEEEEEEGEEEDEEIHHIDCIIQIKCLQIKRRILPDLDDAFFKSKCQMTREELLKAVEAAEEEIAENSASKHALGAAAQALDEITQVEIPESLFETQAEATWRQQVRAREFQGEKDKKTRNKEEFIKWKEENRKGIENILRTAFAIQAVFQKENLKVDEIKLQRDLAKAMLQTNEEAPEMVSKQLYKKAQAAAVYEFILKNANVEYYVDDTPAEITVQPEGTGIPQQGVRAFPKGVDIAEWHKTRQETIERRNELKEKAQKFFIDPKTLKKFDQNDSNKL